MSTELAQNIFSKDKEIHVLVHQKMVKLLNLHQHQYQPQEHANE
jgi:hypothetical protein